MELTSKLMFSILITVCLGTIVSESCDAKSTDEALITIPLRVLLNKQSAVSAQGREILLQTRNSTHGQKYFLVQGGLHGDERTAQEFVVWLAEKYSRGESLLNELEQNGFLVDFLPYSNPDGIYAHQRANHAGINLNRNFGVLWGLSRENPGKSKFSEPETSAIKNLFQKRKYVGAVDVHGYINWVVSPSDPSAVGQENSRQNTQRYLRWKRALLHELGSLADYELKTAGQLGDGGAFEDWAFWDQESYSFCLELKTAERYFTNDGPAAKNPSPQNDTFVAYEKFIFAMFHHAVEISEQLPPIKSKAESSRGSDSLFIPKPIHTNRPDLQ